METVSSPRISFSADFLDEKTDFISICPADPDALEDEEKGRNPTEFEFLSGEIDTMITADELFFEGKLLPFWQMQQHCDKICRNTGEGTPKKDEETGAAGAGLFLDDDPSPRLPKCTVLWKELLKLRRNNKPSSSSSLSPSSSTSSSSSGGSLPADSPLTEQGSGGRKKRPGKTKMEKGGAEGGTKSGAVIRVRPVINVPICTPRKSTSLSPLFPLMKKGNLER